MTPITVNGHNLLVIDVPKEATGFNTGMQDDGFPYYAYFYKDSVLPTITSLPPGFKYKEVGTISKEGEFSFDPSDYVELHQITRLMIRGFKNYVKTTETQTDFTCKTSKESFISLLKSAGIYLSNPMGEKPLKMNYTVGIKDFDRDRYQDDVSQWESNESKTIKRHVLILKQEKV